MDAIVVRVAKAVTMKLSPAKAVTLSLFASSNTSKELCDFLFSGYTRKEIGSALSKDELNMTDDEWNFLFSRHSMPVGTSESIRKLVTRPEFVLEVKRIESVLSLTLQESDAALAWSAPSTKISCFLAMHGESTHDRIESVLGILLRSDARKLEDLRTTMEEEGPEIVLLADCTRVLCQTVCGI